ncbi:MAG: hypothetical protein UMU76_08665 [Prosthecochloris sp.]|nr:hypothetical protein [Prosthecochloris sp.]
MEQRTSKALVWIGAITALLTALAAFVPLIMRLLPDSAPPGNGTLNDGSKTEQAVMYNLEVIGGEGDGSYRAGDEVTVSAEPVQNGKAFSGWDAPSGIRIENSSAPLTTLVMPEQHLTVVARYAPRLQSLQLTPEQNPPWRSGTITSTGDVTGPGMGLGDRGRRVALRAFITFDLTPLPSGTEVHKAHLVMRYGGTNGDVLDRDKLDDGFLDRFIVESVRTGAELAPGDYSRAGESLGQYPVSLFAENWQTLRPVDVTAALERAVLAGRNSVTFRLRFLASGDNDEDEDVIFLDTRGDRLRLEVQYAAESR